MGKVTHIAGRSTGEDKLLVTHTDLDGIGCAVIFLKCYPKAPVLFVSNTEVNQAVTDLLNGDEGWQIMISDLSVNEDVAELLDKRGGVSILDHHSTASWLQAKYSWAVVDTTKCGTRLVYEVLSQYFHLKDYEQFVAIVEDWDLWGKATGNTYPGVEAIKHQFLFDFLGKFRFLELVAKSPELPTDSQELLEILHERYERYYQDTKRITQIHQADGYTVGITIADQHQSLMGNRLVNELDLEYVMIIDPRRNTASLRGQGNIHLGELARAAGGGGHRCAAGFPLGTKAAVDLVNYVERGD